MKIVKQSFLSSVLGRETYDELKYYAVLYAAIGTCILVVLILLSLFFHWRIISTLLSLFSGRSLLFLGYIISLILLLDKEVDVDEEEAQSNYRRYRNSYSECNRKPRSTPYKYTVAWGAILIILGIAAIYFSKKYSDHYTFECTTFLVDEVSGTYHLEFNRDCERAAGADLIKKKGYEIEKDGYTFCAFCEGWLEDMDDEYNSSQYTR